MLKRSNLEILASEKEDEHLELVIGGSPYMGDNLFHINQAETQNGSYILSNHVTHTFLPCCEQIVYTPLV